MDELRKPLGFWVNIEFEMRVTCPPKPAILSIADPR